MIIYLDMDGVCVDLVSAVCLQHGFHYDEESWPPCQRDLHKEIGISYDKFWDKIHQCGSDFWRELEPYPWFDRFYAELNMLGQIYFLSAPTRSPHSASGKMMWLKDRLGSDFTNFIITRHKHLLAARGTVLIDDYEWNIEAFNKNGTGKAILFPQKWNSAHEHIHGDRVRQVINRIRQIKSGQTS